MESDPAVSYDEDSHSRSSSRFTYRHFQLLRSFSTRTPLRVIAHIDLDAFYAQCEMIRLGTPRDQPLAVQQWQSLIAVNYAARPFGVSRMITAEEARKLCPQLLTPHVATFREGEGENWAYRDGDYSVQKDKVSLDPYRAESRKILATMKATLLTWAEGVYEGCRDQFSEPSDMVRLEKAGIDEVFVDLSALVFGTLLQRYEVLRLAGTFEGSKDSPNRLLPRPETTALLWGEDDELIDLDTGESEEDDPEWDDVVIQVGAEIVKFVRTAVWDQLKYTCSGGIARNKMMAKLGSACNKPNRQTIVRNRAIQQFLSGYKFTKIRSLGGKLGKKIASEFETDKISDLLNIPLDRLKNKLDDDTGVWLYQIIRGEDDCEVTPRTEIKSMISAKSFNPKLVSLDQGEKWMRIFVAEIYGRLIDEGVLENKRRPKMITVHHYGPNQDKSRQTHIPTGGVIDQTMLFDLAKNLLQQVVSWPCSHLSLTVSGFESGITGNKSLDNFFIRGAGETPVSRRGSNIPNESCQSEPPDDNVGHQRKKQRVGETHEQNPSKAVGFFSRYRTNTNTKETPAEPCSEKAGESRPDLQTNPASYYSSQGVCSRCGETMPDFMQLEHDDWHLAKALASQEQQPLSAARVRGAGKTRQTKLAFG
ncbi:DNA polymerase eta [Nannizzia gypsea CBS 118893]|uniref:DNA polymerase eta n=1 Tax=Arthroderma gypseum (strain ATCC MYA-4604 / CBS 118893) TaxID=535722 RepID=E4UUK5_ARTGP|nr:DNA polymerase eta [Nannizzia gypsea CBS 118893]EFR00972.1 DNA polymerase eta [Nannizzia gypsea CBS 118893]